MSEHNNEYPLMLYQGGDTSSAYIIVTDADEEKLAAADGFLRHGETSASGDTPLTATQLKEELTKRNVEFRGNASRDALQALYDEALAKESNPVGGQD